MYLLQTDVATMQIVSSVDAGTDTIDHSCNNRTGTTVLLLILPDAFDGLIEKVFLRVTADGAVSCSSTRCLRLRG